MQTVSTPPKPHRIRHKLSALMHRSSQLNLVRRWTTRSPEAGSTRSSTSAGSTRTQSVSLSASQAEMQQQEHLRGLYHENNNVRLAALDHLLPGPDYARVRKLIAQLGETNEASRRVVEALLAFFDKTGGCDTSCLRPPMPKTNDPIAELPDPDIAASRLNNSRSWRNFTSPEAVSG